MEIVFLELQRIRKLNVLEGPTAVIVLEILRAVLEPDADVALRLFADLVGIDVAAVEDSRFPLDAGEASDAGEDAAELLRLKPGGVERADSAGGLAGDRAA